MPSAASKTSSPKQFLLGHVDHILWHPFKDREFEAFKKNKPDWVSFQQCTNGENWVQILNRKAIDTPNSLVIFCRRPFLRFDWNEAADEVQKVSDARHSMLVCIVNEFEGPLNGPPARGTRSAPSVADKWHDLVEEHAKANTRLGYCVVGRASNFTFPLEFYDFATALIFARTASIVIDVV